MAVVTAENSAAPGLWPAVSPEVRAQVVARHVDRKRRADALNRWRLATGWDALPHYIERTIAFGDTVGRLTYELAGCDWIDSDYGGEVYEHASYMPLCEYLARYPEVAV